MLNGCADARCSTSCAGPTFVFVFFLPTVDCSFWALVTDSLSPPDAVQLAEDLGIEYDTPEHVELERGPLCVPGKRF